MAFVLDLPDVTALAQQPNGSRREFSYRPIEEICYSLGLPADDVAAQRHFPCPHCGAKKFRISNRKTGIGGCDECGQKHKDYTALWATLRNEDWSTARKATQITGGSPTRSLSPAVPNGYRTLRQATKGQSAKSASPPRLTNLKPADAMSIGLCCLLNGRKTITDGMAAFGVLIGEFRQSPNAKPQYVLAIPVWDATLKTIINYQVWGIHGPIKIREKNEQGDWITVPHKVYTAEVGTPDGIIISTEDRLSLISGEDLGNYILLKVEGPSDLVAGWLLSRGTDQRVIPFTNLYGARSLHCASPFSQAVKGTKPAACLVCHDADQAGQMGAVRDFPDVGWANLLRDICDEVRNVMLPYEVVPKKGKDLRDWIADGGDWPAFVELIEISPRILERSPDTAQIALDSVMSAGLHAADDSNELTGEPMEDGDDDDLAGAGEDTSGDSEGPTLISVGQLTLDHVDMRPEVIGGLLRVGEVMTAIAPPKRGKSWLVSGLAWSVATGRDWLGFPTQQGRVLMIDNELHPETISNRLWRISKGMNIEIESGDERIDLLPLRGNLCDIDVLATTLFGSIENGRYRLIILDALYRMLPAGSSENDNSAMTQVFNTLDRISARLGCGLVVVHHTSKGDQGGKAITDTGAGAGSVARAADTHLIIRPHVDEQHVVMEAVTRSFVDPEPISIRFDWPLWSKSDLPPDVRRDTPRDVEQRKKDAEVDDRVIATLTASGELSLSELRSRTGFGDARLARSLVRLSEAKKINCEKSFSRKTGKESDRYSIAGEGEISD